MPIIARTGWLAVADDPQDDDDLRRRKHVGVAAGLLTIIAPVTLPLEANGLPVSFALAAGLSLFAIGNLWILVRTHDFDRFVILLLAAGAIFVPAATILGGGLLGPSSGLTWGFLIPAYAILALGAQRSTGWFVVYIGLVIFMVLIDPLARTLVPQASDTIVMIGVVLNTVAPLAIVYLLLRYTDTRRAEAEARANELLTNAIPTPIAERLRRGERRIAEQYPETSILFADIVGFTPWAQRTPPAQVVALLDELFTRFDVLADAHGLEKIKTIGDAWMAVAGAPDPQEAHAQAAVELGLAMLGVVAEVGSTAGVPLEIRIGIASGPVVGGVIGQRRFQFDLWGDTVNLAARMESSGIPGRIQLARSTRDLLGVAVGLEEREVEVKGLGRMTSWLVT